MAQVLMTRAMRERLRDTRPPAATFATIKVRFPEAISLQVRGCNRAPQRLGMGRQSSHSWGMN